MTGNLHTAWCGCVMADPGHRCDSDRLGVQTSYGTRGNGLPLDLANLPIGQRVAAIRKLRHLTQAELAARLHRSESWVTKVERGERRLDSIEVLRDLSQALAIPMSDLILHDAGHGPPRARRDASLAGLRRALGRPSIASPTSGGQPPVRELVQDVATLRRRYNRAPSNISTLLAGDLAGLIGRAQAAVHAVSSADRPRAYSALSELYRLTALALRHMGDLALGRVAIDRAVSAAEQSGDVLRIGVAGTFLVLHLGVQGDADDGISIASELADVLARAPEARSPAGLAVLGGLHNYTSLVAAHAGDEAEARRQLQAARLLAEQLRRDRGAHGVFFGPGNLAVQEQAVLLDLGHVGPAVRVGERVPGDDLVLRLGSVCRTSKFYLWQARGYSLAGQPDEALATVATGVRVAPEMVGEHPYIRELVRSALRSRRRVGEQLRRLARDIGVWEGPTQSVSVARVVPTTGRDPS